MPLAERIRNSDSDIQPAVIGRIDPERAQIVASWKGICRAMNDPAFELTDEEFTEILRTAAALERAGFYIDPALQGLLLVLARQMIGTEADSGFDLSDRWIESGNECTKCHSEDEGMPPLQWDLDNIPLEHGFAAGHVATMGDVGARKPEYREHREFVFAGAEPAWKSHVHIAEDPADDPNRDDADYFNDNG